MTHATADLELPVPMNVLLAEDWRAIMARGEEATTQALARRAWLAGVQGVRVPSKPDPCGVNLIVFPDRLTDPAQVEVLNAGDLDKLGRPG